MDDEALRTSAGHIGRLGILLLQHDKLSRKPADQCNPIMGVLFQACMYSTIKGSKETTDIVTPLCSGYNSP